jgi:hypothetical protein
MRIDLRWIISKSIETREVAGLSAIRNVWSAAALQAKNGNDIVGLRECIRPLCELLALGLDGMRCTLVLFSNTGF